MPFLFILIQNLFFYFFLSLFPLSNTDSLSLLFLQIRGDGVGAFLTSLQADVDSSSAAAAAAAVAAANTTATTDQGDSSTDNTDTRMDEE